MDLSDFEDLAIGSESEDADGADGAFMTPAISTKTSREGDGPRPPWEGRRDKLVGVVDMGRRAILTSQLIASRCSYC